MTTFINVNFFLLGLSSANTVKKSAHETVQSEKGHFRQLGKKLDGSLGLGWDSVVNLTPGQAYVWASTKWPKGFPPHSFPTPL